MDGKRQRTTGLTHPFEPVWNHRSRVLILGSFPSVKSRETAFYYGHPQNRFWRVTAALYSVPAPESIAEKIDFLLTRYIALWDVVKGCDITGSADSTLAAHEYNDIARLLQDSQIHTIFANGQKAAALYRTHIEPVSQQPAIVLPSTSPANAAWSAQRLTIAWQAVREAAEQANRNGKHMLKT